MYGFGWLKNYLDARKNSRRLCKTDTDFVKKEMRSINKKLASIQKAIISLEGKSLIVSRAVPKVADRVKNIEGEVHSVLDNFSDDTVGEQETPRRKKKRRNKKKRNK